MSKKKRVKKSHWIYKIDYQPWYASVYVSAKCSNCGEPYYNKYGAGNPTITYSAMFTNGTKEARISYTKAMAADFLIGMNPLDKYCRNCGAKMSTLDDNGMMDWED